MFSVEPLSEGLPYGVVVRGLTAKDIEDRDNQLRLRDLWLRHGVILYKDVEVTPALHIELSRVFGPLQRHFIEDKLVDGQPELVRFSSDAEQEGIAEVDGELRCGAQPWHADAHSHGSPTHGGILHVTVSPPEGGETGVTCMINAYQRLPQPLKDRIEGLETLYKIRMDEEQFRFVPRQTFRLVQLGSYHKEVQRRQDTDFPPVAHPLVVVQQGTGRKALNISPASLRGVLGWSRAAGDELLQDLLWRASDPSQAYVHKWAGDGSEMLQWDNLRVLHMARGVRPGEVREARRTTIAAPGPVGRRLEHEVLEQL